MKLFTFLAILSCLFLQCRGASGQAVYSAEHTTGVQVGAGFLYLNNDYSLQDDQGLSVWADGNLTRHLGLEAEAHFGLLISPSDFGENTFLVGPRVSLLRTHRSTLYAKAMIGRGSFLFDRNPKNVVSDSYNLYAFGGGVDFHVNRSMSLRLVDAEFQTWPNFKPNGLTPYAFSTGFLYTLR